MVNMIMKKNTAAEFELRKAGKDEAGDIFELYVKRVEWMGENNIRLWIDTDYLHAYPREFYEQEQAAGNLYVLEDLSTGSIAAAAVLYEEDENWQDSGKASAYYVHNLVSSTLFPGAGKMILQEAEKLAAQYGKEWMRLDCGEDSIFLNGWYESMGYLYAGKCTDGPYTGNRRQKKVADKEYPG